MYKFKGMNLAAIVAGAGIFSTLFGFLYGSFFGFEDTVIHHVWLRPKEAMMTLPVIGQMNTVFVVAIVFGMFLILTAMILHIAVSIRNRDAEGWFDTAVHERTCSSGRSDSGPGAGNSSACHGI